MGKGVTTLKVELPKKLITLFAPPLGAYRYRVLRGGRGSGKSFSVAKMSAIWGAISPIRILCTREFQNSIKQSFYAEVENAIKSDTWLSTQYNVGRDFIRHETNGTEYLFAGLRHNIDSIKSMAQIDLVICEEAETIPPSSWIDLLPTIRAPKSEIIIIYNPKRRDSWVAKTFDTTELPPRTLIADINFDDNPFFPAVLNEQRLHDREVMDPALYRHVWEGAYYEKSDAQVFAGKYEVKEFTASPSWHGPYYGLDYGFSQDPTAGVKCWINENELYIEYDFAEVGLELDDTAQSVIQLLPDAERHVIRADNARPESTSYLKRRGLPKITSCKKGKGSVEDGIQFIKSFKKVIIHPRCTNMISEFDLYSYKIDRLSGDILADLVDKHNHGIDACIEHGQLITTRAGRKPVQDIVAGDMVLTRAGYRRVRHAWLSGEGEQIWVVKTKHAELRATGNHLVYTNNRGFARVDALRHNDEVLIEESLLCKLNTQSRSGAISTQRQRLVADRVQTVYATSEKNKVYDLEVEGAHEFVASGILVHNCRYALEPIMAKRRGALTSKRLF